MLSVCFVGDRVAAGTLRGVVALRSHGGPWNMGRSESRAGQFRTRGRPGNRCATGAASRPATPRAAFASGTAARPDAVAAALRAKSREGPDLRRRGARAAGPSLVVARSALGSCQVPPSQSGVSTTTTRRRCAGLRMRRRTDDDDARRRRRVRPLAPDALAASGREPLE